MPQRTAEADLTAIRDYVAHEKNSCFRLRSESSKAVWRSMYLWPQAHSVAGKCIQARLMCALTAADLT